MSVLATVLVLEYVVLPQLVGAQRSLALVASIRPAYVVAGVALEAASLACYSAFTRAVLPPASRPAYGRILRIDLSALGLSHVVPGGGAAATALRYRLLVADGVGAADAVSSTTIQGLGTAVALGVVFIGGCVLTLPTVLADDALLVPAVLTSAVLALTTLAVVSGARHPALRRRVGRAVLDRLPRPVREPALRLAASLAAQLRLLATGPGSLLQVLGWAMGNWLFDAASLWVFLRAFGASQGLEGLLVGYGLAGILAFLPFTPGGLGFVEATLVSMLVLFGTPHATALLGVITWRLAEFWLPVPVAGLCYLSLLLPDRHRR